MGDVPALTKCPAAAAAGEGCLGGGGVATPTETANRCGVAGGVERGMPPRDVITSS
jgi:hypothetical protein